MPEAQATPSSYFVAELGGKQIGAFREIKGLEYKTKVIEVRSVDAQGRPVLKKVSGATETSDITIARYADNDKTMFEWAQEVQQKGAAAAKRDITFRQLDYEGQTLATYAVSEAWPAKYTVSDLSAERSEAGGENLVLAHSGFRKV